MLTIVVELHQYQKSIGILAAIGAHISFDILQGEFVGFLFIAEVIHRRGFVLTCHQPELIVIKTGIFLGALRLQNKPGPEADYTHQDDYGRSPDQSLYGDALTAATFLLAGSDFLIDIGCVFPFGIGSGHDQVEITG